MSLERVVEMKMRDRRLGERPLALRVRRAKRLEDAELIMEEMWVENEREEEMVTPRQTRESTRGIPSIRGGAELILLVLEEGLVKRTSLDLDRLRERLFPMAHCSTLSSSRSVEERLVEGMRR